MKTGPTSHTAKRRPRARPARRAPRVWAVVPAAGLSRRMGRTKQTLPFGDSTLAGTVVRALLEAGMDGIVVVTRSKLGERLELPEDRRVHVAKNDDSDSEMIDSVRIGVAALRRWKPAAPDGVLVVPADMPALTAAACRACASAFRAAPDRIVIATYARKRGHPIVFPWSLRHILPRLRDGLRQLRREFPDRSRLVPCPGGNVPGDVDTPGEYRALRLAAARSSPGRS